MIELTEQQEQEMIDRAKAGDPEANYNMSLWALEQAMAEPDEERWNRLAAKCLVKAAEAGYAPAKEKMDELLIQTGSAGVQTSAPTEPANAPDAAPKASPASGGIDSAEAVTPAQVIAAEAETGEAVPAAPAKPRVDVAAIFSGAAAKAKSLFAKISESLTAKKAAAPESAQSAGAKPAAQDAAPAENGSEGKKPAFLNFSQWDDAMWKKMQTVCIIICVILAILIAIMLITRRSKRSAAPEPAANGANPTIPIADVIDTPEPAAVSTPEPADAPAEPAEPAAAYPDDDTRAEIAAAGLDVYPEDDDFVTEPTTVTVSTNGSGLNVRRGPGSSYGQVTALDNGTSIDVYAYRNGWGLVKADGLWGWCSKDYLK